MYYLQKVRLWLLLPQSPPLWTAVDSYGRRRREPAPAPPTRAPTTAIRARTRPDLPRASVPAHGRRRLEAVYAAFAGEKGGDADVAFAAKKIAHA